MTENFCTPDWSKKNRLDWEHHVPEDVQKIWESFDYGQKKLLYDWALNLCIMAGDEMDYEP